MAVKSKHCGTGAVFPGGKLYGYGIFPVDLFSDTGIRRCGKAVCVIVMVLQIAGSSGTFPIELLPDTYQKIYIFFPFPYAIRAMREALAGMYGTAYMEALAKLSLFMIEGLLIGLVIRIPFVKLNHFVEERMEDTELM